MENQNYLAESNKQSNIKENMIDEVKQTLAQKQINTIFQKKPVDCIEEDNSNISFNMNMSETELNQFLF
ncbi:MAG: hypothetical protein LBU14_04935 [Candidatus Peribacteria bacterium]|jgi:hypothetical protein|nr:hypothetical protein [Candidatus Peribacteria bacterium]